MGCLVSEICDEWRNFIEWDLATVQETIPTESVKSVVVVQMVIAVEG